MEKLIQDTKQQFIDLPETWQKAALRERQELQAALFQSGLVYNQEQRFMVLEPEPRACRDGFCWAFGSYSG
jgi:hypothetical protein